MGFYSCCTKKDCAEINIDEICQIDFYNFNPNVLDTIIVVSYLKNSNYSTSYDSSINKAQQIYNSSYSTANISPKINIWLDYKIKIVSTKQVFTLSGFETEKHNCNKCFLYRPQSDNFYILKAM